jgi:nitrosocyanin
MEVFMKRSYWRTVCGTFALLALGAVVSAPPAIAQLGETLTGAAQNAAQEAAKNAAQEAVTGAATEAMQPTAAAAGLSTTAARKFTVVNVLFEGSKMFVPSVLAVSKGDTVSVTVINNIPGDPPNHGFVIPDFGVELVVNRGEKKTAEFTADKAGIFDITCQLHPAHIHGQLIVNE